MNIKIIVIKEKLNYIDSNTIFKVLQRYDYETMEV